MVAIQSSNSLHISLEPSQRASIDLFFEGPHAQSARLYRESLEPVAEWSNCIGIPFPRLEHGAYELRLFSSTEPCGSTNPGMQPYDGLAETLLNGPGEMRYLFTSKAGDRTHIVVVIQEEGERRNDPRITVPGMLVRTTSETVRKAD